MFKFFSLALCFGLQIIFFLAYLNINIVNVGQMGTGLPLLAGSAVFSLIIIGMLWNKKKPYLCIHFFVFMLLIFWLSLRVVLDLGDMEYLKQITIATTGGIVLFYFLGAFLSIPYSDPYFNSIKVSLSKLVLIVFFTLSILMLYNFSLRLLPDIFYLSDVNGAYQRAGNFLSISFIMVSFFYLILVLNQIDQRVTALAALFWLSVYIFSALMSLVGSQMFGSNSATGVVFGVYLITLAMALIIPRKSMWLSYQNQQLSLPWSKQLWKQLFVMAVLGGAGAIVLLAVIISATDFDINSLRLLGFGSGINTSLSSRATILLETGADQLSYAPLFGNANVAYLTTGDAGQTLHSFFLDVMASLGLVGLTIVLMLFINILLQLYHDIRQAQHVGLVGYQLNMVAFYSTLIFIYILFFANLATGLSWSVLWFTCGFISKPFNFSERI